MLLIVKVLILVSLVKLFLQTENAPVCAGVYAGIGSLFALLLGHSLSPVLIGGAIGFVLAWLYFFLPGRTQGSIFFWIIAIGGVVIGFV